MAAKTITVRDGCTLASAVVYAGESYAYEPHIADEGWGDRPLYAVWEYDSYWPTLVALVTGSSWESAYEAAIDALPTVPVENLCVCPLTLDELREKRLQLKIDGPNS